MSFWDLLAHIGGLAFLVYCVVGVGLIVVLILRSPTYDEAEEYEQAHPEVLSPAERQAWERFCERWSDR